MTRQCASNPEDLPPRLTVNTLDRIAGSQWARPLEQIGASRRSSPRYASVREIVLIEMRENSWRESEGAARADSAWRLCCRLESCARVAYVATRELLPKLHLPRAERPRSIAVCDGAEAYRSIVEIATGLQNAHNPAEYFVLGQVKDRYQAFLERLSANREVSPVSNAVNWAISDAKAIRSHVFREEWKKPSRADAAKKLSRCGFGSNVLRARNKMKSAASRDMTESASSGLSRVLDGLIGRLRARSCALLASSAISRLSRQLHFVTRSYCRRRYTTGYLPARHAIARQ